MEKDWILVVDSGIGGLWTLGKIRDELPNENFLYFMDTLHSPYGTKSEKKLFLGKYSCFSIAKSMHFRAKLERIMFGVKFIVYLCRRINMKTDEILHKKPFNIIGANQYFGARSD